MEIAQIKSRFPFFVEPELIKEIESKGIVKQYKAGDTIIRKGEFMKFMPMVLSGSIRVTREDDNGNEMLLYYLEGGETCAMSITCCMQSEQSNIWAIAEDETEMLMLPLMSVESWMKEFTSWRNFILTSYSNRMGELLHTLDSIAFHSLDERLMKYLKDKCAALKTDVLSVTHSEIARELNSSREAISRLLKKLETLGKVQLGRNLIRLKVGM